MPKRAKAGQIHQIPTLYNLRIQGTHNRLFLLLTIVCVSLVGTFALRFSRAVFANTSTPITIGSFGTSVTQDFNTLASSGTSSTTPAGWGFIESGTAANTTYNAGTGSSNTGDTYSFGNTADRALGGLRSGALNPIIGASFTNNTGGTITSLSISYIGEQWRAGVANRNAADRIDFQISTNATSLTTGTYTDVDSLDFSSPNINVAAGALDGNANHTLVSSSITGLSIPNGTTFFIRWTDFDIAGSDDGLAIDDFSLTANGTIADTAPFVSSSVPASGATDIALNSDVSINFSEPVNVSNNWFQIACGSSGTRQVADTSVSGGPTMFVINSNADFVLGEQCTVTVFAGQVLDQDTNDPPDNMAANAIFSFTVTNTVPAVPSSVVISQLYGGGGNNGANLKNDFIEVVNHSASPIDLTGWSVQYTSATGTGWQKTNLTGVTIQPGQYYLVQEGAGTGGTDDLPAPDQIGSIAMGATAGKIALVSSTSTLTGACPSSPSIVDFVGYGTANCFEGLGAAPNLSNTTAALRNYDGCADSDNNSNDFSDASPNPRNTSSPFTTCNVILATASASPNSVAAGDSTTLKVAVSPAVNPPSTGMSVVADLSSIGGSAHQAFSGVGNTFTFGITIPVATSPGVKTFPVTVSDAQTRTVNATIPLIIQGPHIRISQIYGGGGNSSAPYNNDFVELSNPLGTSVDLTGWSIQYASETGSGWETNRQPIGGTIGPGEYYLVALGSNGTVGSPLPAANISGEINMSATAGKVALVNSFQALSGPCPLFDTHVVDFVGYGGSGSGFCFEGTAGTAAPSNTTALLRNNDGATDTDSNINDFVVGAPSPRRTAPIVELGPIVLSTDPSSNGFNVPHDGSVGITFTEPVNVVGPWFDITCASSAQHNSATIVASEGGKTQVITPNINFQFGEQCTVTINKDYVHDQDLDDSAPDTDSLHDNYVWSFTVVGAGQPAPYPPDVHLTMGNPSNAVADLLTPNNYLMVKPTYSLSYNRSAGTPNWVSWHLDTSWFGSLARVDTFRPDPAVPPDWYRVQATDYFTTGFDRGHMTPNADRDNENRIPINQETYLMTNMVPQAPDNNQGPWANFENYLRGQLNGNANEMYIVSGPLGVGGTGTNGFQSTIAGGNITVPAFTWKVVLLLPKGTDDISRVTAATRTIAVMMPNKQGIRTSNPDDWMTYLTTVDAVEEATGYEFFSNVPDAIENAIEAGTNGDNPPGTEGQAVKTPEDTSKSITLTAVSPVPSASFTFTIVTPPTHGTLTGLGASKTYEPDPEFYGSDNFTFKVNDGVHDSNTSTVNILVTDVNDSPSAVDDSESTDEDTPLDIAASDLATNDTAGPANEGSQNLTITSVSATADTHGAVMLSSGIISYSPDSDYNGLAAFTYQVCDDGTTNGAPDSKCSTGNVNVTVNPVNDGPTLSAIANQTVYVGNTLTFTGVGSDIDVPAQNLTYSLTGSVPAGATIGSSSGTFSWTPAASQGGQVYTFNVRVTDDGLPNLYSERVINIGVAYTWSEMLAPIHANGTYKTGRTIPLKFQLTGASDGVRNAVAKLFMFKISNNVLGDPVDVESGSAATAGNIFRYDPTTNQYIFNLDTSGLTAGTYQLQVDMGDSVLRAINISLR
ncbi:MAG: DNA/RNA non-specific endonuclease [Pyrinomonadaceae bacterium]